MRLPIRQVDAFTEERFRGNPAAVVLLERELPDETLQAIAAENNLSETAFVLRLGDIHRLRWFTPQMEVDLCGHATLASAYVLFKDGIVGGDEVHFDTLSGRLNVSRLGELLTMDFPSLPTTPIECTKKLVAALGATPMEVHEARDVMAVFETEQEIRDLHPDFDRIAELETFAVMATAPGSECDFVSRFFAPKAGVPEDPVTGSAHCSLVPYWSQRVGRKRLLAWQLSRRGGELFCEDLGDRVSIGGRAVEFMRGEIQVD